MKVELVEAQETAIAIRQETENLIRASLAPNTLKAYEKALKGLRLFLERTHRNFLITLLRRISRSSTGMINRHQRFRLLSRRSSGNCATRTNRKSYR